MSSADPRQAGELEQSRHAPCVLVLVAGGGFQWEAMALVQQLREHVDLAFITPEHGVIPEGLPRDSVYQIPEVSSRADHSYRYIVRNLVTAVSKMWRLIRVIRPDAIICVGSSMSVPIAVAGRLRGHGKQVFVESITRTSELSATGKWLLRLRLVDRVYVQWPEQVGGDVRVTYKGTVL